MEVLKRDSLIEALSFSILFSIFIIFLSSFRSPAKTPNLQSAIPSPSPTIANSFPYILPKVPNSRSYRIMMVGDSMVGSLGANAQLLRQHLIEYFPNHEFVNYNYGFGSTNIETLPARLTQDTIYNNVNFPSILSQGFDLVIIESFAYNPLSQEVSGEGLNKHLRILEESIRQIIDNKPDSIIAIMTPIAPNKKLFAKSIYKLTTQERVLWVEERISYIKGVREFAMENHIPLIDVYEKSLTPDGDGNLKFINPDDYIHPSAEGVDLISKTIAEFIYNNKIFLD